jgi:hypothetical protein
MTKWEYLLIAETRHWNSDNKDFEDKYWVQGPDDESFREKQKDERLSLNVLGDEGWELVSELIRENGILMNNRGLNTGGVAVDLRYTFKRPKP